MVAMSVGSMMLPIIGMGNLFWTGGVILLAIIVIAATHFARSRS